MLITGTGIYRIFMFLRIVHGSATVDTVAYDTEYGLYGLYGLKHWYTV